MSVAQHTFRGTLQPCHPHFRLYCEVTGWRQSDRQELPHRKETHAYRADLLQDVLQYNQEYMLHKKAKLLFWGMLVRLITWCGLLDGK